MSTILVLVLSPIVTWIYILICHRRKKKAGNLLLNVGQTIYGKIIFWMAILLALLVFPVSILCILQLFIIVMPAPNPPGTVFGFLVTLICTISGWAIVTGLYYISSRGGFELRENGICCLLWFLKWEQYESYTWLGAKKSILYAPYKSRFLILRKIVTVPVPIPTKHRSAVDQIVAKYLPRSTGKS
jgi:uncharacterized membrane protein (DUF485 family)